MNKNHRPSVISSDVLQFADAMQKANQKKNLTKIYNIFSLSLILSLSFPPSLFSSFSLSLFYLKQFLYCGEDFCRNSGFSVTCSLNKVMFCPIFFPCSCSLCCLLKYLWSANHKPKRLVPRLFIQNGLSGSISGFQK